MKTVAIIGAGGLGGPIAMTLAGRVHLVICDHDRIEPSNLPRQIQFGESDVGRPKAIALAERVGGTAFDCRFTRANADVILDRVDCVVDGTDSFDSKFLVSDLCVERKLPGVISAVTAYAGQVMPLRPPESPCYRCFFESPPPEDEVLTCAQGGVLGGACALIASRTAAHVLTLLDDQAPGPFEVFEDLRSYREPRKVTFAHRKDCAACGPSRRTWRNPYGYRSNSNPPSQAH